MSCSNKEPKATVIEPIACHSPESPDSFITEYLGKETTNAPYIDCISAFDQRRAVFISLIGLYQSWRYTPPHVLYSAIFLLPLKSEWIRDVNRFKLEMMDYSFLGEAARSVLQEDSVAMLEFIELLRWKDSQNLVFWMLDDYYNHSNGAMVAPFWVHFSSKLTTLYDPVTQSTYRPLKLNQMWWEGQFGSNDNLPKFERNVKSILPDLMSLSAMKFSAISEIIYQSNPESLNPVIRYRSNIQWNHIPAVTVDGDESVDQDLGEGWWISVEYEDGVTVVDEMKLPKLQQKMKETKV